jgi:hypothetical protein
MTAHGRVGAREPTDDPYFDSLIDYGEPIIVDDCQPAQKSEECWLLNPADWEGREVPQREWIVQDLIPAYTITLLTGDGATGKSLLALQLCAGMACKTACKTFQIPGVNSVQ